MVLLKCAKCGAEISEEQLTCSACGFVNDIEVCKKLAGQEELALQEKAEREQAEKLVEQKKKLSRDQEVLYSCIKKKKLPAIILDVLLAILFLVITCGIIVEAMRLTSEANQMGFYGETYLADGLRVLKNQGAIPLAIAFALFILVKNGLVTSAVYVSLDKKMDEIKFNGNAWLKDFQKTRCLNGITLEKELIKEKRNYDIAIVICHRNNPKLQIIAKNCLFSLLSGIASGVCSALFVYFFMGLVIMLIGKIFITKMLVGLIVSFVVWIVSAIIFAIVSLKVNKVVSEELKKFDVQPEQPTQPEQNA